MFESIAEALHAELLKSCPPDRAYTLADLKARTLPEPVGLYAADLARKAAAAELKSAHPEHLRWTDNVEDTVATFERHVATSLTNAVVPAEEWEQVLREATGRAIEHTVRPRSGLVSAVFGDSDDTLDQPELIARMSLYHAGLPLRAAVVRALKKGGAQKLDRDQFMSMVDRAHDTITFDFGRTEWHRDLETLVSLLATAGVEGDVPIEVATALLDDVEQTTAAESLRAASLTSVNVQEIVDLLAGPEDEDFTERQIDIFESAPDAETDPGNVPLWRRFQKNLNEPIVSSAKPLSAHMDLSVRPESEKRPAAAAVNGPSTTPRPSSPSEEESQKPLWQKYHAGAEPGDPDVSEREIEFRTLGRDGTRNRDTFIAELFEGDEQTYIEVLHELQHSKSWPQASRVIAESVFKRFQVNIYSDEAVAFTNAVESRFRVKEAGS
ncbi:MAG: hypothetical protein HKN37_00405 [Rhodothermales bacterium]|nr:hypothetical protein [Rhodothermales bacterium]